MELLGYLVGEGGREMEYKGCIYREGAEGTIGASLTRRSTETVNEKRKWNTTSLYGHESNHIICRK